LNSRFCCSARRETWTRASTSVARTRRPIANRRYPTFALAMAAFDNPAWDVLSPDRPLRRWHLVEINQSASQSLTVSVLRVMSASSITLKVLNYLD
jgi:hypothetical protein